jgi:hypothetical protein
VADSHHSNQVRLSLRMRIVPGMLSPVMALPQCLSGKDYPIPVHPAFPATQFEERGSRCSRLDISFPFIVEIGLRSEQGLRNRCAMRIDWAGFSGSQLTRR